MTSAPSHWLACKTNHCHPDSSRQNTHNRKNNFLGDVRYQDFLPPPPENQHSAQMTHSTSSPLPTKVYSPETRRNSHSLIKIPSMIYLPWRAKTSTTEDRTPYFALCFAYMHPAPSGAAWQQLQVLYEVSLPPLVLRFWSLEG